LTALNVALKSLKNFVYSGNVKIQSFRQLATTNLIGFSYLYLLM
jgi:hypothetical protein